MTRSCPRMLSGSGCPSVSNTKLLPCNQIIIYTCNDSFLSEDIVIIKLVASVPSDLPQCIIGKFPVGDVFPQRGAFCSLLPLLRYDAVQTPHCTDIVLTDPFLGSEFPILIHYFCEKSTPTTGILPPPKIS